MPLTDEEASRLLPPEINTPVNRLALINAVNADVNRYGVHYSHFVARALIIMQEANAGLITDANFQALIRAGNVVYTLGEMRMANADLITEPNFQALIDAGANAGNVGWGLIHMRFENTDLITDANRVALIRAGANADRVGRALSEMRRANADLITDANRDALIRAGANAGNVGAALSVMRRANVDLITDANREALIRAGTNAQNVGRALSVMRRANPALITPANLEALIDAAMNVGWDLEEIHRVAPALVTPENFQALINASGNASNQPIGIPRNHAIEIIRQLQPDYTGGFADFAGIPRPSTQISEAPGGAPEPGPFDVITYAPPLTFSEAPGGAPEPAPFSVRQDAPPLTFSAAAPQAFFGHLFTSVERTPSQHLPPSQHLQFWLSIIPDTERPATVPAVEIPTTSINNDVSNFLVRLRETAEYTNERTRPTLASRVIKVFEVMSVNEEFRNLAWVIIANSLTSCSDNIILGLDNLETSMLVHQAEHSTDPENELRALGKRMLMLEKVEQKITEYLSERSDNHHVQNEALEIALAFKTRLKERLNLPFSTTTMLFRGCAHVTDAQIDTAGALIESQTTDDDVNNYLSEWEPWKKYQRRQESERQNYENLALREDITVNDDWVCPLSETDFRPERAATDAQLQPVIYSNIIYNYDDFRKVYINQGKDPLTQANIIWSELRRVNLPPQQTLSDSQAQVAATRRRATPECGEVAPAPAAKRPLPPN